MQEKGYCGKGAKRPYKRQIITIEHTTTVHAVITSGEQLPTMIICKGCISNFIYEEGLPNGWLHGTSESNFLNRDFFQWMQKLFVPWAKKRAGKVVLIIDNARCHYSSQALQLAIDNNFEIIPMPPNTSSFLQPLDQLFFILYAALYALAARYSITNAGFIVNKSRFATSLRHALDRAFTTGKIITASAKTGLFPIASHAINQYRQFLVILPLIDPPLLPPLTHVVTTKSPGLHVAL